VQRETYLNFYKNRYPRTPTAPVDAEYPCVVYLTDNWDDYSYKTLFHFFYFRRAGEGAVELGDVKILQADVLVTSLPPAPFDQLPSEYVSLGQNLTYYSAIRELGSRGRRLLGALNDVVLNHDLLDAVETTTGFRNALIRFNEAKRALRYGLGEIQGEQRAKGYAFEYHGQIPGADRAVVVNFDLNPSDLVPGRIAAIIGRNGVGKTQFLARLAIDLATPLQLSKESADEIEQAFSPRRPLYSRVIALSFSAFDRFLRPQKKNISYIYCGVRDSSGKLSRSALEAKHLEFLKRIREQDRASTWERHVANILGVDETEVSLTRHIRSLTNENEPSLSSGQSILTYFTSAALAYLKEDSLLLFDEPEIHLHPSAVAVLMQILHSLLEEFDSYAIVATHSPVVIQEVPGRHVIQFEREDNLTVASPLPQESFGESISELTRIVFETVEAPSFYKSVLKGLAADHSFDEVSAMFEDELSLHAAAYLASLYENTDA
jgi:ABC-type transport system involved in cytochrome c biogenesis ATPase subunit